MNDDKELGRNINREEALRHLPSEESGWREAERVGRLFDDTSRRGASNTGGPAIRPSGLRESSEFIDTMTPGKMKAAAKYGEKIVFTPELVRNIEAQFQELMMPPPTVVLPQEYCITCDDWKVDPNGKHGMDFLMFCPEEEEQCQATGLKPGELIISFQCGDCVEGIMPSNWKPDEADKLIFMELHEGKFTDTQRNMWQARQKPALMKKNIVNFIKSERMKGASEIFWGEKLSK